MNSEIKVYDVNGNSVGSYKVSEKILAEKIRNHDMFMSIIAEQAGRRQGTHSTLTKGEVRGGGKKPYKQKHTGNARQGSIRNPHFVGGGIAFGPKPNRNYKIGVNKTVHSNAMRSAYTQRIKEEKLFGLTPELPFDKVSTKSINEMINKINENAKKILVVLSEEDKNVGFLLSTRNIARMMAKT